MLNLLSRCIKKCGKKFKNSVDSKYVVNLYLALVVVELSNLGPMLQSPPNVMKIFTSVIYESL